MKQTKRLICLILAVLMMAILPACSEEEATEAVSLSFKSSASYDYLKSIHGKTVSIKGYMATSSPVDGSFMFLMNLPYQSCPFCEPNTNNLSNTMEVFPKEGERFDYTAQAIEVVGTLEVAPDPNQPFTDKYGYQFNFKIVDASYTVISADDLSEDIALWQKLAESDVITEIYAMYDYVNFLCAWDSYFVDNHEDENGNTVPGYYLHAEDAKYYLYTEGAQWNYGYKEGYFEDIRATVQAVDPNAFADLVANIDRAESLAKKALNELEAGNYTKEYQFVEKFGTNDYIFKLTNSDELIAEMKEIYNEFATWLGSWEM